MYQELMRCLLCMQEFPSGRVVDSETEAIGDMQGSVSMPSLAPRVHECTDKSFGVAVFIGYRLSPTAADESSEAARRSFDISSASRQ